MSDKKDWKKFKDECELQENEMGSMPPEEYDAEEGVSSLESLSISEIEEKLTLTEQKAHENWEKAVRAMAELDNVRRRAEKDVANAYRFSLEKMANSLLSVVDSLDQALELAKKGHDQHMQEGLELTMKLFLDVLQKFDVKQLDPLGERFDPQLHEAMAMQPTRDVAPNTVLTVFQKGYMLHDRVIRPARVVVSKED